MLEYTCTSGSVLSNCFPYWSNADCTSACSGSCVASSANAKPMSFSTCSASGLHSSLTFGVQGTTSFAPYSSPTFMGVRIKASIAVPVSATGAQYVSLRQYNVSVDLTAGDFLGFYSTTANLVGTLASPGSTSYSNETRVAQIFAGVPLALMYQSLSPVTVPTLFYYTTQPSDYLTSIESVYTSYSTANYAVCHIHRSFKILISF